MAEKKKTGRKPIVFDLDEIKRLASRGLSDPMIARVIGVERRTIANHRRKNEAFCAAIEEGKAIGLKEVLNKHYEAALMGNVTAQMNILKNKLPDEWKDRRKEDEHAPAPTQIIVESGIPNAKSTED